MNADIITDTTYPHGTVEGFEGGCNTAHCPADVSCKTVFTRFNGDYGEDPKPWVCDDGERTEYGACAESPECWGHGHDYEPRDGSELL